MRYLVPKTRQQFEGAKFGGGQKNTKNSNNKNKECRLRPGHAVTLPGGLDPMTSWEMAFSGPRS